MNFALGTRSRTNLALVHPDLVSVVTLALSLSSVDFGVPEKAWRTVAEQQKKVRDGVSQTMHSNHLVRDDGFGHAVDLVPYINGAFTWSGDPDKAAFPFYAIATAMRKAAVIKDVSIAWGAVWDKRLENLGAGEADMLAAMTAYKERHAGTDFIDFPHYQLET